MDHFLFLCTEKLTVWTSIWHTYFGEYTFNIDHVRSALYQLQFPCFDSLSLMLDPEMIFGLALLGIWRSHWLFVFNGIPFIASPVTQNIRVKQRQAHRALPFFSID